MKKAETKQYTTLDHHWMPFTANRQFKAAPRMLVGAQGVYYKSATGRDILDITSGLWCCNAGHCHPHIQQAVARQASELDHVPFQMGHPDSFALAERLSAMLPETMNKVFFTNSGSESVETCLKIALAYQHKIGQGSRTRLIGREKGFHGVNFGGVSVGGIVANRSAYGPLLPGVDHICHTLDVQRNRFSKGQPVHGEEFADDLLRLIQLHGASTIAAVIVEPVSGSPGVIIPPKGYLQRLRQICDQYGILLIFDEVITGYGRLGTAFATDYFGVKPDLISSAKGITNGIVSMGAVFVSDFIYDAFMQDSGDAIELYHGYTASGAPVACAAAQATLDVYENQQLFASARSLAPYFQESVHSLADKPYVRDIRNIGLMGAIELESIEGEPTKRAYTAFINAFHQGLLIRTTGDTIALAPPLVYTRDNIDQAIGILGSVLDAL